MNRLRLWLHRRNRRPNGHEHSNGYLRSEHETNPNLFPVFPPPAPWELLANRATQKLALRQRRYAVPDGEMEDKPLYALYRLYEHIVLDNNIGMRNEIEAFWWKQWPVNQIPDPEDTPEPARYAVLACIPALLVEAFNQRIEMGLRREGHSVMSEEERDALAATPKVLEEAPEWTSKVLPLKDTLYIPHEIPDETQLESLEDQRASVPFKEKNILIWHPHIHFM